MSRKTKYSYEQKAQECEECLSVRKSASQIEQELSFTENGEVDIRTRAYQYKSNGSEVFFPKKHNR